MLNHDGLRPAASFLPFSSPNLFSSVFIQYNDVGLSFVIVLDDELVIMQYRSDTFSEFVPYVQFAKLVFPLQVPFQVIGKNTT